MAQVEEQRVTIPQNDSITRISETPSIVDSIDSPNAGQEKIEDIIDYTSEEQYFDPKNQRTYLVTNAVVKYLDMEIMADYIEVDLKTGNLYAVGKQDSTGKVIEPSIFKQGGRELEYGSFTYNINTTKGKAFNVRTEESMGTDRGVVVAGVVKQYNDSISGMRKIAYTTDEYFIDRKDTIADYHLEAQVGKLIKGDQNKVVTGPIVMKIYDITTPLTLPFAFLPTGSKRSAGILLPSFGERENLGFYIQGLGLYLPLGEYVDLAFTGDVYTKGSLGLHALSNYKVRYKFSGTFNFDWEKNIRGIKGLPSYNKSTNYNLRWTHRQDPKSNPNLTFNASVNLQSSKYYQQGINNYGIASGDYLNNNVNSSVNLTKNWPNSPFSASLNLMHNQRVNTGSDEPAAVFLQLPSFALNMSRIYPFAPKNGPKKGMLQSLGMTYNFTLLNEINTNEDEVFKKEMFDDTNTGAKNTLLLNTGTTLFNYFPLNFGANYDEVWTLNTVERYYDASADQIITEDRNGFKSYRTFGVSMGLQTTLYGTKIFGTADDDKMIKAIRHMMSPNLSFNYRPDFGTEGWGYYRSFIDGDGFEQIYSIFEGGVYGAPTRGLQENLSFGIANNIEMKVRDRKSTDGVKKIKILETLNINSNYNFAADSMRLGLIRINGRTSLFQNKVGLTFNAQLDPYEVIYTDEFPNGRRIDKLGSLRLNNYGINLSYNFNQDIFGERVMNYDTRGVIRYEDFYFDNMNYAQFLTPWSLAMNLSHRVTTALDGSTTNATTVGMRASISPTPHWAISGRTSLDIQEMDFAGTYLTFSRDLRSFVLDFSMNPFGQYKTWNFFIGIKANFLRDAVKYEERNFRSRNNNF
ncbi:LPS-assembly protein LptD [Flavobacteriaceae bacterium Ap0902]|nr:LPS-assembly protein LptD [Flavobacteriaceae bacterium Ap0902]